MPQTVITEYFQQLNKEMDQAATTTTNPGPVPAGVWTEPAPPGWDTEAWDNVSPPEDMWDTPSPDWEQSEGLFRPASELLRAELQTNAGWVPPVESGESESESEWGYSLLLEDYVRVPPEPEEAEEEGEDIEMGEEIRRAQELCFGPGLGSEFGESDRAAEVAQIEGLLDQVHKLEDQVEDLKEELKELKRKCRCAQEEEEGWIQVKRRREGDGDGGGGGSAGKI